MLVVSPPGRVPGRPGCADEAQPQLRVLGLVRGRRGLEHEVAARLGLREGHDLADVRLEREKGRPAINAERDPAVRWRPVVERLEQRAEHVVHPLKAVALQREAPLEELLAMDPDGATTELPAVEDDVVLHRPGPAGRILRRGLRGVAGRRHQERLVLGDDAAERVVGRVPAAVVRVPLVHREAVDPAVGENVRVGEVEPGAKLGAEAPEDVGCRGRRVGDDQDEVVGAGRRLLEDAAGDVIDEELGDRTLRLAVFLRREVGQALRSEPLRELR